MIHARFSLGFLGLFFFIVPTIAAAEPPREPRWSDEQRRHWSFVAPEHPDPPQVKNQGWCRNPIDAFVLEQIEALDLAPAQSSDRGTLLRRLTFDLTGLPPTPQQIEDFVADSAPDVYEKQVDRLLASPQYGERWAKPWLDLARFAESEGFKSDNPRPHAWRYRDWVIQSLNQDMPYDQFVQLQIAGDQIAPGDPRAFVATGFNRNWPTEDNNKVPGLNHQLMLDDITDTTSSVFLGLTLACARCHNHKYDPLSQKDYYRFEAFFGTIAPLDDFSLAAPEATSMRAAVAAEYQARVDSTRKDLESVERPYRKVLLADKLDKLPTDVRKAFETEPDARSAFQEELLRKNASKMTIEPKKLESKMTSPDREVWNSCRQTLDDLRKKSPPTLPTASGMSDDPKPSSPVRRLKKGNFNLPGEVVDPGVPSVLAKPADRAASVSPRRRDLAEWLVSPSNPLLARVVVNRIWQGHFGKGIVATTSDFGTQGAAPSHPELLDWLATELIARGWSMKAMHRLMVTSATYRQLSVCSEHSLKADPDNMLFTRMNRRRLEAEAVRDTILAVSGNLDERMEGPGVFPELPPGVQPRGGWTPSPKGDRDRRSIYVFVKRNLKLPLFDVFDAPDTNVTCPERLVSVNAPQALALLNSDWVVQQAEMLAARASKECGSAAAPRQIVDRVYRLALGRPPSPDESYRVVKYLEHNTLVDFCHSVINLNEFVFID